MAVLDELIAEKEDCKKLITEGIELKQELMEELLKTNQELTLKLTKNLALQKLVYKLEDEIKELKSKLSIQESENNARSIILNKFYAGQNKLEDFAMNIKSKNVQDYENHMANFITKLHKDNV